MLVVCARQYGQHPAEMFAKAIGAKDIVGRFIPGTMTNPEYMFFTEPDVVVVTDPIGDAQAVSEAINDRRARDRHVRHEQHDSWTST